MSRTCESCVARAWIGAWSAGEPASGVLATINGGLTVTADQAGEAAGTIDLGTVAGQTGNLNIATGANLTVGGGGLPSIRVGQAAEMLGVSDSLVSDYRKRIEANLQELSFNGVNEARQFEKALKSKVREMITVEKQEVAA